MIAEHMNFIFYSVTGDFNSFHRKREIESIVSKSGAKALYFHNPQFFLKALYKKFKNKAKKEGKVKGNIKVGSLYTLLPISFALRSNTLMYFFVTLPIKVQVSFAKKNFLGNELTINWFYKPDQYLYLKNAGRYIYLHYDNYKGDSNYKFSHYQSFDLTLKLCVESSLITLISSSKLYERYKIFENENIYYYPNAISRELINSKVLKCNSKVSKCIGFIGQLDKTFDFDLIKKIAFTYPDYLIVLIGPEKDELAVQELKFIKNVSLLGFMDYEQLSNKLQDFQLGICPYKISDFNQYRNPLKIIEYFSYGIPVVTVSCDISEEISDLVSVAEDHEQFIQAVKYELSKNTLEKQLARQSVAKANCWDNRAEFVLKKLSVLN